MNKGCNNVIGIPLFARYTTCIVCSVYPHNPNSTAQGQLHQQELSLDITLDII